MAPRCAAHDAQDGGEPQAAPGELGGEEGIEDAAAGRRRPCPRPCPSPRGTRSAPGAGAGPGAPASRRSRVATRLAGAHGDRRPARSPMASAALMMRFITTWRIWVASRLDRGQVRRELVAQRGPLGTDGLEQLRHLPHERRQVERLDHEAALAGVGQHLVGELGGALAARRRSARRAPRAGESAGRLARAARSALPRMATSRLLKSWAIPPASTPRLSSFCACRRASWAFRYSVMSWAVPTICFTRPSGVLMKTVSRPRNQCHSPARSFIRYSTVSTSPSRAVSHRLNSSPRRLTSSGCASSVRKFMYIAWMSFGAVAQGRGHLAVGVDVAAFPRGRRCRGCRGSRRPPAP